MTRLQIASLNRLLDLVRSVERLQATCRDEADPANRLSLLCEIETQCDEAEELLIALLEEDET